MAPDKPRVVLMCHAGDRIDMVGLAAWLASSMTLAGIVLLREPRRRKLKKIRREIRRVGWLRFLDVLAFRLYYRLRLAHADAVCMRQQVAALRAKYPADPDATPTLVAADPNTEAVREFLRQIAPDLMIARCKFLLKADVYNIPRHGTFVLHPGICPEYRNAHGCFWALANRDLTRVGMTLLRVDDGIDTGAIFLQATYAFDEVHESPFVIQYRTVVENLDAIAGTLSAVCQGRAAPIPATGRASAIWGQPWLSAYCRWKWAARRALRGWRDVLGQGR
ncbi:MAG: formyltransferase family protein [Sulfurifustis sp.]